MVSSRVGRPIFAGTMAAALMAVLLGSGCARPEYAVEVRNMTGAVTMVSIVRDEDGKFAVLAGKQIGPNDVGAMAGVKARGDVYLQAGAFDIPQFPARVRLQPGLNAVKVTRQPDVKRLDLEVLPRS